MLTGKLVWFPVTEILITVNELAHFLISIIPNGFPVMENDFPLRGIYFPLSGIHLTLTENKVISC